MLSQAFRDIFLYLQNGGDKWPAIKLYKSKFIKSSYKGPLHVVWIVVSYEDSMNNSIFGLLYIYNMHEIMLLYKWIPNWPLILCRWTKLCLLFLWVAHSSVPGKTIWSLKRCRTDWPLSFLAYISSPLMCLEIPLKVGLHSLQHAVSFALWFQIVLPRTGTTRRL